MGRRITFRKDWIYIHFKDWIYISLENPFKEMKKLKGVFKPLKRHFRVSKNWGPILWCSWPAHIQIITNPLTWKDKYDTPRFECCPYIWIHLFGYNFIWYWSIEKEEEYWEQALWYLYYYNNISYGCDSPNIEKAKESWPWVDCETKQSSWNDGFLLPKM